MALFGCCATIMGCEEIPPRAVPAVSGAGASAGGTRQMTTGGSNAVAGSSGGVAESGAGARGSAGGLSGGGAGGSAGTSNVAGAAGQGGSPPVACDLAHAKGVETLTFQAAGLTRKVRLFVPKNYDGTAPLPLVLNLHGSTDNADDFAKSSGMEGVADAEGFVVAGLEAVAGTWNTPPQANMPDDVAYASVTIAEVAKRTCIDTARVYATGFSGGGRTSSQLGCQLPDQIAAIGPIAGVRFPAPCPGRSMPVITIHGLADTTNAYAGEGPEHPRWNESVESAVLGWATKNGCDAARLVDDPAGPLSTYSYGQCQEDATVKLIRMDGVEHVYPTGTPLNTGKTVWDFVKSYRLE
jgi:polyhydroxybutyrate depolymerase